MAAPGRMASGTHGKVIKIKTNSFVITQMPQKAFFQYDAIITPKVPRLPRGNLQDLNVQATRDRTDLPPRQNQEIISYIQHRMHPDALDGAVFDGKRILYCPRELNFQNCTVNLNTREPSSDRYIYDVKLVLVRKIEPRHLNNVLRGGQHDGMTLSIVTLLQLILRQDSTMKHPIFTKRAVFPGARSDIKDLRNGLVVHRGYFQSVRPAPNQMIVQVDVTHSAVHKHGNIIPLAMEFLQARDPRDLENKIRNPSSQEWKRLCAFFKGLRMTSDMNPNIQAPRARPIKKLIPAAGSYEFTAGEDIITVNEYYHRIRNRYLEFPGMFGVVVGRDSVIPAEHVMIVEGQMYKKKLPAELMPDLLGFATQKPDIRLGKITQAVGGDLLGYKGPYMRGLMMKVNPEPIQIRGRLLESPALSYGNETFTPRDGSWNMIRRELKQPGMIPAWCVARFDDRLQDQELHAFLGSLVQASNALGIKIRQNPPPIRLGDAGNVAQTLMDACRSSWQGLNVNPNAQAPTIIIAILPDFSSDVHRSVKHWGDAKRGVPTQCINASTLRRNVAKSNSLIQYTTNIALKINVKIGGVNAHIAPSPSYVHDFTGTMILGADVGHPGPGIQRPSMASVVYSVDENAARYGSLCEIQHPRTEMIADMHAMAAQALKNFNRYWEFGRKAPGRWPLRLVMYRDGLSEGEFEVVADQEIKAIKAAISEVWQAKQIPAPKPPLTYLVVGKRHHARFFPETEQDRDKSGNVKAGLVVDEVLSDPTGFDFYLQSHGGLLGTSRPSHYTLRLNEIGMDANQLQRLTFALCHVYARSTRSVSLPAPVYYADLVCGRAAFHFDRDLNYETDTVASGESGEFDLARWKSGFDGPKGNQATSFYFM